MHNDYSSGCLRMPRPYSKNACQIKSRCLNLQIGKIGLGIPPGSKHLLNIYSARGSNPRNSKSLFYPDCALGMFLHKARGRQSVTLNEKEQRPCWSVVTKAEEVAPKLRVQHLQGEPICVLNGGERKRVALPAAALVQDPTFCV